MSASRRELGTPARLIGFAVVLAAVFGLAFLTGSRFGPDVTPAPATAVMAGHDRASDGAVHHAELVLDVA